MAFGMRNETKWGEYSVARGLWDMRATCLLQSLIEVSINISLQFSRNCETIRNVQIQEEGNKLILVLIKCPKVILSSCTP